MTISIHLALVLLIACNNFVFSPESKHDGSHRTSDNTNSSAEVAEDIHCMDAWRLDASREAVTIRWTGPYGVPPGRHEVSSHGAVQIDTESDWACDSIIAHECARRSEAFSASDRESILRAAALSGFPLRRVRGMDSCDWYKRYVTASPTDEMRIYEEYVLPKCANPVGSKTVPSKLESSSAFYSESLHLISLPEYKRTEIVATVSAGNQIGTCTLSWQGAEFSVRYWELGRTLGIACALGKQMSILDSAPELRELKSARFRYLSAQLEAILGELGSVGVGFGGDEILYRTPDQHIEMLSRDSQINGWWSIELQPLYEHVCSSRAKRSDRHHQ